MENHKLRPPPVQSHALNFDVTQEDVYSPSLPMQARVFRRMRRHLLRVLSRKTTIFLAVFLIIFFGVLHTTDQLPTYESWKLTSSSTCASTRTNPHGIAPPRPAAVEPLSQLWQELRGLFDAYVPSPSHLDVPKHESDLNFPTKEQMASYFTLTDKQAGTTRARHQEVLDQLKPYPEGQFSGRGVVMLAGGKYSEYAATSLGMLREVGSQLPVEVWIKDEREDIPGWCAELEQEGMSCRRITDYMDPSLLKHSYALKVFTMLFSSFEEILFLDADSAPIQNPDSIFDSIIYEENGAILWPDYWKHTGSPWTPYILGLSDSKSDMLYEEQSVESGQIVWNKKRHWKSLLMTTYYNYYGPEFYYTLFNNGWAGWGDKDSFAMGLRATYEHWVQVEHDIITVFLTETMLGIGMIQASPMNETVPDPMFLHCNMVKWSMREFSCVACDDQQNYSSTYHLENLNSPINMHLREGKRIFAPDGMKAHGIDPEPLMWKSMEHTACRSAAWGREQACKQTRHYMEKAFGYKFRKSNPASIVTEDKDYCIVEPS